MTLTSALDDRYARWANELYDWGYEREDPPRAPASPELALRGRRQALFGEPSVVVDVRELWLPGDDPDGLGITLHGCYLVHAGWNAQLPLAGSAAAGAERLDVDRSKPTDLMIHRHPLGQPNNVRQPEPKALAPAAWLGRIDELVLEVARISTRETKKTQQSNKTM